MSDLQVSLALVVFFNIQDVEENAEPAEVDISEQQVQIANTDSQVYENIC